MFCNGSLALIDHSICPHSGKYDYDLVVIGGGSGGLACSKEGEFIFFFSCNVVPQWIKIKIYLLSEFVQSRMSIAVKKLSGV